MNLREIEIYLIIGIIEDAKKLPEARTEVTEGKEAYPVQIEEGQAAKAKDEQAETYQPTL